MKSGYFTTILAILGLALAVSCARELDQEEAETDNLVKETITATVILPEESAVRLAYEETDPGMASGLKSKWETGDSFYALQDGNKTVQFTLSDGAGTSTGVFTTEATGVTSETTWKAVLGSKATVSSGKILCDYDAQEGAIAKIGEYDYTIIDGTGNSPEFDFSEGSRLSYFMRIKLPAGIRYIEYCTTASWKVNSSGATIVHDGNFDIVHEIDLGAESQAGDVCYMAIPATQYGYYITEQQKGVILTFMSADRRKSNGKVLSSNLSEKGGKVGTFDVSAMTLIDRPLPEDAVSLGALSVTIRKDPDSDFCNKYNNLGDYQLTTVVSPEWAPFNLGARVTKASPTADDLYGDSFMWGEVAPRTSFSSGSWTYDGTHTVGGLENFQSTQLGYFQSVSVSDGLNSGTMKFQRISGTKYDAARVRWGHDWRMPTIEELVALVGDNISIDISDTETTTPSGLSTKIETIDFYNVGRTVKGRWFSNGTNKVFLPFGGWYGTGHAYYGARGFYWSDSRIRATPSNGNLTNATLRFEMTGSSLNYGRNSSPSTEMYYGLTIRPVRNLPSSHGGATSPSIWEDVGESTISPTTNLWGVISDSNGNPIPGVTVSDGYICCTTDVNGTYQMHADSRARTVNVTIPAGYEIPLDANGRPAFYQYVTIPSSGAVQKDFTLTKRSSIPSRFTILAIADAHVQTSTQLSRFQTAIEDIEETATALKTGGIPVGDGGAAGEVIAIALGDQLSDKLDMASSVITKFNALSVPVFYTIGNHDHDSSQESDYDSENAFVNAFGPTNYSFDIGNAHIIVMDDIIRRSGNNDRGDGYYSINYGSGFTQEQVDWLNADIAKVSGKAGKVVVFCCHAPLNKASGGDSGTQNAVMGALKNNFYNVHVLSGHTHCLTNNLYSGWAAKSGRQIYEHTLQTLSGYFWQADIGYDIGSPAGYGVLTFGTDDIYAEYNKTTKEEPSFQFRTYNGGESYTRTGKTYSWDSSVSGKYVVRLPDAGDSDDSLDYWKVYLTKNGTTTEMTRVETAINDRAAHCYIAKMFNSESGGGGESTDQFWYSSASFASSGYTITAVHTMKSGWSATYTGKHYVGNNTFKGFAYGERYND